jgi:pre-mRNA-splicing factor ATP-dependent RNA helicase DHX38/PRP16
MNLRDSQRVAEIEKNMAMWDEVQLMRSGVVERMVQDDYLEEREAVILVVKDAKPPFLEGRQIFTKQMEPVVPLKDPTSDMAVVARKGSKLVMQVCLFPAFVTSAGHAFLLQESVCIAVCACAKRP